MLASDFGTGQVLWSFIWFTMFFIWIWLLIMVFSDIFRSHDLGGVAKAIWCIFIIVIPYLGFTLTIFLFLLLAMLALGVRSVRKLIGVALTSAVVGYLMFIVALDTPFPHGPVEMLLGKLF
jgi:hypothetical protein